MHNEKRLNLAERHLIFLIAVATLGSTASGAAALGRTKGDGSNRPGEECRFSLDFLRRHYSPPEQPGDSNYFIDLWAEASLSTFARECRVTDNHALFINSHGGSATGQGRGYLYYPHESLLRPGEKIPHYSAADFAAVLGPENAARIHNILVSGCDADGAFSAGELRRHFVNATNVPLELYEVDGSMGAAKGAGIGAKIFASFHRLSNAFLQASQSFPASMCPGALPLFALTSLVLEQDFQPSA